MISRLFHRNLQQLAVHPWWSSFAKTEVLKLGMEPKHWILKDDWNSISRHLFHSMMLTGIVWGTLVLIFMLIPRRDIEPYYAFVWDNYSLRTWFYWSLSHHLVQMILNKNNLKYFTMSFYPVFLTPDVIVSIINFYWGSMVDMMEKKYLEFLHCIDCLRYGWCCFLFTIHLPSPKNKSV